MTELRRYRPQPANLEPAVHAELLRLANTLENPSVVSLNLAVLNAPPARVQDGDIVYADGTNWNPGAGVGFYGRQAGAWVKL